MPIKRPTLHLNLPALHTLTSFAAAQTPSTQAQLHSHFERLTAQIRDESAPLFREAAHAPDYSALREGGFLQHNGFSLYNSMEDVFIHARREQAQCTGTYDGDKLHISVNREQVPQAFDVMASLLLCDHSPIDKWKVTDINRAASGIRVSEGAQFTLYVKPDTEHSQYTAHGLNCIRHFVQALEAVMTQHQIQPGQRPDSDIHPNHWQYSSYRNELRSQREGGEVQRQALGDEPFYRLITE